MKVATGFDKVEAWNTWCDSFLQAKTMPMSREQTEVFLSLIMMEQKRAPMPEEALGFQYKVAAKRAAALGLDINPYALMMICILSNSVGNVVMYVTALTRYYHRVKQPIDTRLLAEAFPVGFPTSDELHRLWDEQKGGYLDQRFDNLLDWCLLINSP
jgi:hypothetical protein